MRLCNISDNNSRKGRSVQSAGPSLLLPFSRCELIFIWRIWERNLLGWCWHRLRHRRNCFDWTGRHGPMGFPAAAFSLLGHQLVTCFCYNRVSRWEVDVGGASQVLEPMRPAPDSAGATPPFGPRQFWSFGSGCWRFPVGFFGVFSRGSFSGGRVRVASELIAATLMRVISV